MQTRRPLCADTRSPARPPRHGRGDRAIMESWSCRRPRMHMRDLVRRAKQNTRSLGFGRSVSGWAPVCLRNECSALAGMIVTQYGQISRENSLAFDGRGGLGRQSISAMEHLRAHYGLTPHGSPTSGVTLVRNALPCGACRAQVTCRSQSHRLRERGPMSNACTMF